MIHCIIFIYVTLYPWCVQNEPTPQLLQADCWHPSTLPEEWCSSNCGGWACVRMRRQSRFCGFRRFRTYKLPVKQNAVPVAFWQTWYSGGMRCGLARPFGRSQGCTDPGRTHVRNLLGWLRIGLLKMVLITLNIAYIISLHHYIEAA